jgi:hypothetical protein
MDCGVMLFDRSKWLKKCWGKKTPRAKEDVKYVRAMARVVQWCAKNRVIVDFEHLTDVYGFYDRDDCGQHVIKVDLSMKPQFQYYVLLHECGHYLIDKKRPLDHLLHGYISTNSDEPLLRECDILEEEMHAWLRGRRLAGRLRLPLEPKTFEFVKVRSLVADVRHLNGLCFGALSDDTNALSRSRSFSPRGCARPE